MQAKPINYCFYHHCLLSTFAGLFSPVLLATSCARTQAAGHSSRFNTFRICIELLNTLAVQGSSATALLLRKTRVPFWASALAEGPTSTAKRNKTDATSGVITLLTRAILPGEFTLICNLATYSPESL